MEASGDTFLRTASPLGLAVFAGLLEELGDEARPARLVTGTATPARVGIKIFVEERGLVPIRVRLELLVRAEDRTMARVRVLAVDAGQAAGGGEIAAR